MVNGVGREKIYVFNGKHAGMDGLMEWVKGVERSP